MFLVSHGPYRGAFARCRWIHHKRTSNDARLDIQKYKILIQTLDSKIAQDRRWTCSFSIVLFNTMPSEALVRVVKFQNKKSETEILFFVQQHGRPQKAHEHMVLLKQSTQRRHTAKEIRRDPTRPYMEITWDDPVRENKDQAQRSCTDSKESQISRLTTKKDSARF